MSRRRKMNTVLEVKDLCKSYTTRKVTQEVLHNISFTFEEGEYISIMGPSGSGKSTLLYTVSGMDSVTKGEVLLNGRNIAMLNSKQLAKVRLEQVGFVFQQMYMMKNLCIFDNIVFPGYQARKKSRKEVNERANQLVEKLGILEYANKNINEVSGGQLQRACVCRALINSPRILFADEPTGALNSKAATSIMEEFVHVNQNNTTIMMVTHSAKMAAYSDKVIYLVDGTIQGEYQLGKMRDVKTLQEREVKLQHWLMEQGW